MPRPRPDVARAFLHGQKAKNSTGSFRSIEDSARSFSATPGVKEWCLKHQADTAEGVLNALAQKPMYDVPVTAIYTYGVALAVRMPDGTILYPPDHNGGRTLDRKYSNTTSSHQAALRSVLG